MDIVSEYLSLVIKGDRFTAARAAADRGIPAAFVEEANGRETVAKTGPENLLAVAQWFAESPHLLPGQGFPEGTLLLYSHHIEPTN